MTDCYFPVRQLRLTVSCISFGCIFLYIISGVYLPTSQPPQPLGRGWLGRHLLELQDDQGDTNSSWCNNVTIVKDGKPLSLEDASCSDITFKDDNVSTSCDYVRCVDDCKIEEGLFDYPGFIYCVMPPNLIVLAMVILFFWLVFLFIVLGATAEEYFCPALTVMSQVLRLSQNVAGVTLLALGNGAPDIFSAFSAINNDDDRKASLAFGGLFGAGIFVTTVVVGAVTITKPFTLTQRPFLRDIIFYMIAVFWTFFLLWNHTMNIYNGIGFVLLYVLYVIVVILGRVIYQKWKKWRKINQRGTGDIPTAPSLPQGDELNVTQSANLTSKSQSQQSSVPRGPYSYLPSPDPHLGLTQTSIEAVNSIQIKPQQPKVYRFPSLGASEVSGSEGHTVQIQVMDEEEEEINEEGGVLIHKERSATDTRQNDLTGSLPSQLQSGNDYLALPSSRKRGGSVGPHRNYGAIWQEPSIQHRPRMRKTLSGALDITEGVGAAVGIPHLSQVWEEVHRSHSRNRPRSNSRRLEVTEQVEDDSSDDLSVEDDEIPLISLKRRPKPFVKMLQGIWPFGENFKDLGPIGKFYEIIKSPASVLLALTVPVVDSNEDNNNWNKWLNVLQCVVSPMFIVLITKVGLTLIGGVFPVAVIILCVGLIFAAIVAFTSRNDKPPIYHCVFAWVGFAVAVTWIYTVANEIVNLLQAFGVVIHLSEGILGLTLLAWGNSIGDAVSNVTMAKQGFPRMAIGACFGGPLLNMLLGIGVASVVKSIERQADGLMFRLYFTQVELLAALFLMASLATSLTVIFMFKFRLNRVYGIVLLCFYVIFLVVAILAEAKVFLIQIPDVIDDE